MTNLFTTIKENQASRKFTLVRIEPSRFLNDDLASIGGGKYTVTMSGFVISSVYENGVALSLVTGTPAIGEYSFDEDTGLLTVYPNAAPSSTNALVANYYLFYTGERNRVLYQDPEDDTTTLRDWEPKILSIPRTQNSIENIEEGVFTIKSSSFSIINDNNDFEQYLSGVDSFYQKNVLIWICLDSTDNIQKIFNGKITRINIDDRSVVFNIENATSSLLYPAFMGDASSEVYWTRDDFPNLNPNSNNQPIPYYIGTASRYQLLPDSSISTLATAKKLDKDSLPYAACTNYSTDVTTSNNREWGICRVSADSFLAFGFTPSAIDNSDPNYTRLSGTFAEIDKFRVGDTFVITQASVDYYLRVVYVDRSLNYVYTTKEASISTGAVVSSNNCPSIVLGSFDQTYYAMYGRDYTATVTTTSGGNKYLKITFANNFEANHAGLTVLNPGDFKIYYRIRPDTTNGKHGSVLKNMLEKAGMTTVASTFTTANTNLDAKCNFSIPTLFEQDFSTYVKYVQDILKSTLGYITINNDFEIEYHLYAPPAGTITLTDTDILEKTSDIEIEYRDIVSSIIAYNPNWASDEATEDSANTASKTLSSNKTKYLHGIDKAIRFVHVLEKINDRLQDILDLRSERKAFYSIRTKTVNLDSIIGDDFILSRGGILGSDTTKNLKIISINKSQSEVSLILTDLYNLS